MNNMLTAYLIFSVFFLALSKASFELSPMVQQVKNPPAVQETQETQVWSLGQEDPLEEEMVTHSSILAWKNPKAEEPGGLRSKEPQGVRHDWAWRSIYIMTKSFRYYYLFRAGGNEVHYYLSNPLKDAPQ